MASGRAALPWHDAILRRMTTSSKRRARNRRGTQTVAHRRGDPPAGRPMLRSVRVLPLISGIAIVGGALLIAAAVVTGGRPQQTGGGESQGVPMGNVFGGAVTHGYVLGDADAPVTIDLYEDFQCPACRRWGEVVFSSLAANEVATGRAKLVFHDFPFIGSESFAAARAGYAAARQDRFWDLWVALYANQGPENAGTLTTDRLTELARGAGLSIDRFTTDMASPASAAAVDEAIAHARRLGVDSTPTVVVAGRRMVGASYDEIAAAIADAAPR